MSQISANSNYFLKDPTRLNHVELRTNLSRCLDPLPSDDESASTMSSLAKAASDQPAAILVPLLRIKCEWHILMTKRADHLEHHAGQVSFPGGKVEFYDASPVEAALREAFEEIRLTPKLVQVAGLLDRVRSPAGFLVQPVVGIVCDDNGLKNLESDPAEVDLMFTMPLTHLANPDNFRLVPRKTGGRPNDYWVVEHNEHLIWGLSARVLYDLHRRIYKTI